MISTPIPAILDFGENIKNIGGHLTNDRPKENNITNAAKYNDKVDLKQFHRK